ncbi:MAG: ferritin [Ginsengibacter sp.]|jgi:ferritin
MNTNRLSDTLCKVLNAQITQEAHSAQIYLSYASWAKAKGYDGISNFLFRHANEERNHMMKFLEYVLERGAKVTIQPIPEPGPNPTSIYNAFEKAFAQEVDNTTQIYKIVKMSLQEEDWITWNFLQWFVKEQNEEETLIMGMLDKLKISGEPKASDEMLYVIDRDLKGAPDEAELARDKTTQNP